MAQTLSPWDNFWFHPASPSNLGACRVVFCAGLLAWYVPFDFSAYGSVSAAMWKPVWFLQLFDIPLFSTPTLRVMEWTWKGSILLCCAGLLTRTMNIIAVVLGAYLLALYSSFGKISHQHQLIWLILAIMTVSRWGDAYSVDRLIRRRRLGATPPAEPPSGEYTWPVRLVWLMIASVYFAAGIAKLRLSGFTWGNGFNISNMILMSYYGAENTWNQLGFLVARHEGVCAMLGYGSLLLECSSPLILFNRWARLLIVSGLAGMQLGIYVLMGINFSALMVAYIFFVPWDRLIAAMSRLTDRFKKPAATSASPAA